jgi:hypothetical protein
LHPNSLNLWQGFTRNMYLAGRFTVLSASFVVGVLVISMTALGANASSPDKLAFGNVVYHHFLDSSTLAYTQALYFEQRNENKESNLKLEITRAGLALDLGLDQLAQSILANIGEENLGQLDRGRLHFQLARDAYRRQDWLRFERELTSIGPASQLIDSSQVSYLQAELARLKGNFKDADNYLGKIQRKHVLRYYSGFNIGITALAAGDSGQAAQQLNRLVEWPARTLEQLLIAERSRIVLAGMEIDRQNYGDARKWLTGITATGQYGPAAFATLAHLSMKDKDYAGAADLWFYLVSNTPWHPAVVNAHVSLPYALEQVRGSDQAYVSYQQAALRLDERSEMLEQLLHKLRDTNPGEFVNSLNIAKDDQTQFPEIATALGHGDWANWLASEYSQRLVNTWRRVSGALDQLAERQQDLKILMVVDGQQQLRIRNAALTIVKEDYGPKTNDVELRLDHIAEKLLQLTEQTDPQRTDLGEALLTLATADEVDTLNTLQQMSDRANRLNADVQILTRINRLRGLMLYRIHDDLPVRVRKRQVRVSQMRRSIAESRDRTRRIRLSASVLGKSESVGGRITLLSNRTNQLMANSEQVLGHTGTALLAQIEKGIRVEMVGIEQQLVDVRLAMARIGDARLLASYPTQVGARQ